MREVELKRQHEEIVARNAREMVAGAYLITKSKRFKTLFYGLKLNQPRNSALVHPLMYTVRRVIYALAIVLLAHHSLFGVWILTVSTLLMLVYALNEEQWRDPIINQQHFFNEIVTYLVSLFLLIFNGFVKVESRVTLGYILIGLVSIFLVYNGIIMLRKITRLCKLLLLKWRIRRQQNKLRAEARAIAKKIKAHLDQERQEKMPLIDEDNYDSDDSEYERL